MSVFPARRIAVTGLGIITAIGESVAEFETALFHGLCGIGPISLFDTTGFPCQKGAQVKSRELKTSLDPKEFKRRVEADSGTEVVLLELNEELEV